MARLVVVNGPPGIGKSTLARRWADEHPPTLVLDIDTVRRMLGGWERDPERAGLLARALALEMARAHLAAGHDVLVPQYLGRPLFLEQAEQLAARVGARFVELVLLDEREPALRRFVERTAAAGDPAHVEAGRLLARRGGHAELAAMYDRLLALLPGRPHAQVIPCRDGAEDAAYAALHARLDGT